ncbi:diguanylate cyclase domain-containing protein [Methylobacterium sp. D54C]
MPLHLGSVVPWRGLFAVGYRALRSQRSIAALASLLVFGLVLAACLLAKDLRDGTIENTERDLRGLTTLLAEQADRTLIAVEVAEDDLGQRLADTGVGTSSSDGADAWATTIIVRERLDAVASALPQIVALAIVDRQGVILNASQSWPTTDRDVSERPFFRRLAATSATRTTIVEPTTAGDGVAMTLHVARRISALDGSTQGYILAAVDMRYFERIYADVSPMEADVISMVSDDRTMLARYPSPSGAIGRVVPPVPNLRRSMGDPEGSGVARMVTPIDGRDRYIAIRPLDHFPLIVGASRTVEVALTAWRRQTLALGVTVIMLVGALVLLLGTNARQIRDRNLLANSEAARKAAEAEAVADRRLKDEYARFGSALDGMGQGLCVFDTTGRVLFLNARMATLFELPEAFRRAGANLDGLLTHIRDCASYRQAANFVSEFGAVAQARMPAKLTCPMADGRILGVTVEPVGAGDLVCTFDDETERRRAEALISHMAHHDSLTGLPNRVLFNKALQQLLVSTEQDRHGVLLLLDLDGFKQINDIYGHPFGDALLSAVSDRLRGVVDEGCLLARLGGDEFAVVCNGGVPAVPGLQPLKAIALAGRIVAALKEAFQIDGVAVSIGTSIGIACVDGAGQTVERLLRNADVALYRSKSMGRSTWCLFEPQLNKSAQVCSDISPKLSDRAA